MARPGTRRTASFKSERRSTARRKHGQDGRHDRGRLPAAGRRLPKGVPRLPPADRLGEKSRLAADMAPLSSRQGRRAPSRAPSGDRCVPSRTPSGNRSSRGTARTPTVQSECAPDLLSFRPGRYGRAVSGWSTPWRANGELAAGPIPFGSSSGSSGPPPGGWPHWPRPRPVHDRRS